MKPSREQQQQSDKGHTPGPWEAVQDGEDWCVQTKSGDYWIAKCYIYSDKSKTGEENARLIAAAPELLEALERLLCTQPLAIDGKHGMTQQVTLDDVDACRFARNVIAKARG